MQDHYDSMTALKPALAQLLNLSAKAEKKLTQAINEAITEMNMQVDSIDNLNPAQRLAVYYYHYHKVIDIADSKSIAVPLVDQQENSVNFSHEFLDFLISFPLTREQLVILLAFARRSYKNYGELTAATGLSRETSTQLLYDLEEMRVIEIIGDNWTLSGYRITFEVSFKLPVNHSPHKKQKSS